MSNFALDISRFTRKTEARLDTVLRKVSLDLDAKVVRRTPVDTGRARASWNVGINNADPSVKPKSYESGAQGARWTALIKARRMLRRLKAGDTVFITNNVKYIKYLEEGKPGPGSDQAPNGMVEVTLVEYPGIVRTSAQQAKAEHP